MKHFALSLIVIFASFSFAFAQDDMIDEGDHVFEVTIYEIADADPMTQEAEGYIGAREYPIFFALAPQMEEGQMLSIRITEWESAEAYEAAMIDEAYIQNVLVEPFVMGEEISLDDFPGEGEVLEIAIRDLSSYEDPVDFMRTIRGFTDKLVEEDGVVREYEWISVDGQFFVGMTRYESMEAFQAASQSESLLSLSVVGKVFSQYPPMVAVMGTLSE